MSTIVVPITEMPTGDLVLEGIDASDGLMVPGVWFRIILSGRVYEHFKPLGSSGPAATEIREVVEEKYTFKSSPWTHPPLPVRAVYREDIAAAPAKVYQIYAESGDTLFQITQYTHRLQVRWEERLLNKAIYDRLFSRMEDLKVQGFAQALDMGKTNPKAAEIFVREKMEHIQELTEAFLLRR